MSLPSRQPDDDRSEAVSDLETPTVDRPHAFVSGGQVARAFAGVDFCAVRGCRRTIAEHDDWLADRDAS